MDHKKKQSAQVLRGFGVIIFFFLFFRLEAVLQIIDHPLPVEAALGQDVMLPCVLTNSSQPILHLDLLTASVRWDMTSINGTVHTVYLLTDRVHTVHRNKSKIEESEFRRGIASLSMRDVLESDEGEYTCSVYVTPNKLTAKINVQVSARPNITLTLNELTVEPNHERSVVCEVNRFYPKSIIIRWFKSSKGSEYRRALDKETCNSVPVENNDGTFNATSLIVVKPSSTEEDGDIYSCIVSHRSFNNNEEEVNFTLTVKEQPTNVWVVLITIVSILVPCLLLGVATIWILFFYKKAPQISSITGEKYLVHMKQCNLFFCILDFKPRTVNVKVYLKRVNDAEKRQICLWKISQEQTGHQSQDIEVQPLNGENAEADTMEAELEPLSPKRSLIFYSCPCTLRITPNIETDDGAELTVQVEHSALKSPISQQCTLTVKGDCLKLSPVVTPKYPMHGEEVTYTCNITKYSPGPLSIIWLKKDVMKRKPTQVIFKKGGTCDGRYSQASEEHQEGGMFSYSSSLAFTANVSEDHGQIYICRVYYRALDKNMQLTFDTYVRAVPVLEPIKSKPAIPSTGQQLELYCNILRFHPQELTVEWYMEDELVPHTSETRVDNHGLYNVTSTLKLTLKMEDLGKKFKCKVGHESLEDSKILEWMLNSLKQPLDAAQEEGPGATMKKEEEEYERRPLSEPSSL